MTQFIYKEGTADKCLHGQRTNDQQSVTGASHEAEDDSLGHF